MLSDRPDQPRRGRAATCRCSSGAPTRPLLAISSGPLGGGIGVRHWVINATVPMSYAPGRPRRPPGRAGRRPRPGRARGRPADRRRRRRGGGPDRRRRAGLGDGRARHPGLAAAPDAGRARRSAVGTVNIVVYVPARLGDAALVNAVATATEAKAQAIWELGLPATGTPTDAVTVLCPADGAGRPPYGGPRSTWGAPLARAVHAAVLAGGAGRSCPGPTGGRRRVPARAGSRVSDRSALVGGVCRRGSVARRCTSARLRPRPARAAASPLGRRPRCWPSLLAGRLRRRRRWPAPPSSAAAATRRSAATGAPVASDRPAERPPARRAGRGRARRDLARPRPATSSWATRPGRLPANGGKGFFDRSRRRSRPTW